MVVGIIFAHREFRKSSVNEIEKTLRNWNDHCPYKDERAVAPVNRVLSELLEKIRKI